MPDAIFADPRLAAIYDALEPDRADLDAYLAIADELRARRVLDIGCGTGVFVLLLIASGRSAIGLDPAAASLDVARAKPGAEAARWILGDAARLPRLQVDLVTMTGNVSQAILAEADWRQTIDAAHSALRPGGHLVFETRVPARQAWRAWTRDRSWRITDVPHVGPVRSWVEVTEVSGQLVSFRWNWRFPDGLSLTSESTLRFRESQEIAASLEASGFELREVRDAPDRPGAEHVFIARRRSERRPTRVLPARHPPRRDSSGER